MKVKETIYSMQVNHGGIRCALFYLIEKVRQRDLWTNYGQKTDKINNISTIDATSGTARVPKCREETTQFDFLGFWCNYVVSEQLEAKNLENFGFFGDLWLFLGGFWPVAALKPRGCINNLKNRIVWFLPNILVPLLSQGLRQ